MREPPRFKYPTAVLDELVAALPRVRDAADDHRGIVARQQALLRLVGARGLTSAPEQIERIFECRVIETLNAWLDRVLTVDTVDELLRA